MNGLTEDMLRDALQEDAGAEVGAADSWEEVVHEANRRRNIRRGLIGGASVAIVAAAALVGAIYLADDDTNLEVGPLPPATQPTTPPSQTTATTTATSPDCVPVEPESVARAGETPAAVLDGAAQVLAAAAGCDYGSLRVLMPAEFEYILGGTTNPDEIVAEWQNASGFLTTLVRTLRDGEVQIQGTEVPGLGERYYEWVDAESGYHASFDDEGQWIAFTQRVECSAERQTGDVASPAGAPTVVMDTARAILTAASACDWEALHALMADEFTYSFGGTASPDEAITVWREEDFDTRVLATLVDRLRAGIPTSFTSPTEPPVTYYEWADPAGEFGYRVGITDAGEWVYFVAGD
jgi:hypothetical protein